MKRSLLALEAVVLALASAWAGVSCLVSAFELPVQDWRILFAVWAACAVVSAALLVLPKGGRWLLLLGAAGLYLWFRYGDLTTQILAVLGKLARTYDGGYGWGIPGFLRRAGGRMDEALMLLGVLQTFSVCVSVCRRGGTVAVGLLLLPLLACLVVTDTVPETASLFTLLLCVVLLLLTKSVRAESAEQGGRLLLYVLIPAVLALGLLFWKVPLEGYVNQSNPIRDRILSYIRELPDKLEHMQIEIPSILRPQERVNLTNLNHQPMLGMPVAEITAERDSTVYLRVRDYDRYTGTAWVSDDQRRETIVGTGEDMGAVVVRELSDQNGMLVPSFPAGDLLLFDGLAPRPEGERVYRVERMSSALGAQPASVWLELPEETAILAGDLLAQLPLDQTSLERVVEAIGDYVRNSAAYDRNTRAMPAGEQDFAIWFLREAERGYCVHFASAAAVLLRSAGIPARYVTGYKAEAKAGETVRVTSDEAHAWVEYYNPLTWAWNILEATPGTDTLTLEEEQEPETSSQPTEQETEPTQAGSAPEVPKQDRPEMIIEPPEPEGYSLRPLLQILGVLLGIALLCGAVEGQRILRIRCRLRRQQEGKVNAIALACWKETRLLYRLAREAIPEELPELAEKAMFSQHDLTGEELAAFTSSAKHCRAVLRSRNVFLRIVYRYWYAVL